MNRRDLLKMFGVGATIAPVVGGALVEEAKALVVAPPLVELAKPEIVEVTSYRALVDATRDAAEVRIFVKSKSGATFSMKCDAFVSKWEVAAVDVTTHRDGNWQYKIPGLMDIGFRVHGIPTITKSRA